MRQEVNSYLEESRIKVEKKSPDFFLALAVFFSFISISPKL